MLINTGLCSSRGGQLASEWQKFIRKHRGDKAKIYLKAIVKKVGAIRQGT